MQKKSYPLEKTREPGVYRRGNSYVVVYRDPSGHQRKKCARTYEEARSLKSNLRSDINRGEYRAEKYAESELTFEDYAREWVKSYTGRTQSGIREQTLRGYEEQLERDAIPFFGKRRLAGIGPRDIKRFVAEVQSRGVGYHTVRLALAPVRALFATALEEELVQRNPTVGVRIARPAEFKEDEGGEEQTKAFSPDELTRFLAEVPPEQRLLFELMAHTGVRIAEAFGLRWGDIEGRRLKVRRRYYSGTFAAPKSKYGKRDIPLSEGMARKLWAARQESSRRGDEALVFAARDGQPLNYSNLLRRVFKPAARASGVGWAAEPGHGFHVLRHTCASTLFRSGLNAKQVQVWLGHHSPAFTLATYVHLLPEDMPSADFLDKVIGDGGQQWATRPTQTEGEPEEAIAAISSGNV